MASSLPENNKAKMREAVATAHTFKMATSVADRGLKDTVRIGLKDRFPSEAGVRHASFAALKCGMSVILPGEPVGGSTPAELAEAWTRIPLVEGIIIEKKENGAVIRVYRGLPELTWNFGEDVWLPAVPDGGFGLVKNPGLMFTAPGKYAVSCAARIVGDQGGGATATKDEAVEESQVKSVFYVVEDHDGRKWRIDSKSKARERVEKLQGLLRLWREDMIATLLPDMTLEPAQLRARITYVATVSGAAGCALTEEMAWFPGAHLILGATPFTDIVLFEKVLLGQWYFGLEVEQRLRLSDFSHSRVVWSTSVNAVEQFLVLANCCEMVQRMLGVLWAPAFCGVMDPVVRFLRDASGQLRLVPPIYIVSRIETALHRFATVVFRDRVSVEWGEQRKTLDGCVRILVRTLQDAVNTEAYEPFPQAVFFAHRGEFDVLFRQKTAGGSKVERLIKPMRQPQPTDDMEPASRASGGARAPRASGDKRSSDQQLSGGAKKTRRESVQLPCLRFLGGFCKVVDKNTGPVKCERDPCRFLHSVDMLKGTSSSQAIEAIDAVATRFSWQSDLLTALKQRPQLFKQ